MNRKLIKNTQALVTMMAPVERFLCEYVSCGSCFMSHTNRSAKDQGFWEGEGRYSIQKGRQNVTVSIRVYTK